jgi:glutamate synthase (NADPH/NADH) small chain
MSSRSDFPLPQGRLEERFEDKRPLFTDGEAAAEAARCLYCHDAPCIRACPTHIDVPTFIKKIATKNFEGSARTILEANLLGASCARVCPVEVMCEGACVFVPWNREAISIGRLQRFAMERGAAPRLLKKAPPSGRSVGLVGSGPASLACAGMLTLLGHEAIVYEKDEIPGGLNSTGVAPYKLPVADTLAEVEFLRTLGVQIRTGIEIGRDVHGGELLRKHDVVFLGVGLGSDLPLRVPGAEGPGVVGALDWIRRMKLDPKTAVTGIKRAAVIGGGNTAIDVARELAQLGVSEVRLVYRRSAKELRAYDHEWLAAKQDGVLLITNAMFKEIIRQASRYGKTPGRPERLRLSVAKDGLPTNEERAAIQVDKVIVAIGRSMVSSFVSQFPGVSLDATGRLRIDPKTGRTGNPRVFAAGDATNGGKEVVDAVAEGQAVARAIDSMLHEAAMVREAVSSPRPRLRSKDEYED